MRLFSGTRRCPNLAGASEAELKLYACSKCATARYCRQACQTAAWKAHRAACKRLQGASG